MDLSVVAKYLPHLLVVLQVIGFIVLYINTNKMSSDPKAQEYYSTNLAGSILVSAPLVILIYLGVLNVNSSSLKMM